MQTRTASTESAHPFQPNHFDTASLARRILELPPMPTALAEAMRVLADDEAPAQDCVRAIERDPTLAMRVMQLANSGFYASPSRVGTLGDAVRMLGLRAVGAVLAAVSIKQMMGRLPGIAQSHQLRWQHALAAGCAARELARVRGADTEEAFVAGLLHDVGAWLLAAFAPDEVTAVQALQRSERFALCEAERQVLGFSHEEIGAQVAQFWRFPADTAAAITHHHRPRHAEAGGTELEWVVHAAESLAHELGHSETDTAQVADNATDPQVWKRLGLDPAALALVRERTLAALSSMDH